MASSKGRIPASRRSLRAIAMPSGKPSSRQKATEVMTSARVTMASFQAPIRPTATSESIEPMASRRPPNCQATRPMRTIMISAGTASNACSMPFSVASIGKRIAWNAGRKLSTTHSRP